MPGKNDLNQLSEFLSYLANDRIGSGNCGRLPALKDLSGELNISVASLREQMEVARALGFVEAKPKTGIRHLDYSFRPAVEQSVNFAIAVNPEYFELYSDLRNHVETAYYYQAVKTLTEQDRAGLKQLIQRAFEKLNGSPVQIPHFEHRELHLSIYRRLGNPFVIGILEAYWDLYEAVGLDVYTDYSYLVKVWQYHRTMVENICSGNYAAGNQALTDHMNLLSQRARHVSRQKFE
jgi:DNA-binding FadR family transcriptional regulator